MTEPISRRQTLQILSQQVRFLLAISFVPLLSSCRNSSFIQPATIRPKGDNMNQTTSLGPLDPYRLPRHVVPTRYELRLEPDLTAARFSGAETITLTIHRATFEIVLNAIELDITSSQVEGE